MNRSAQGKEVWSGLYKDTARLGVASEIQIHVVYGVLRLDWETIMENKATMKHETAADCSAS